MSSELVPKQNPLPLEMPEKDGLQSLIDVFKTYDTERNTAARRPISEHLLHVHSEADEIWDAIRKKEPRERLVEEVADLQNMVAIICQRLGLNSREITNECHRKFREREAKYPHTHAQNKESP